MSTHNHDWAIWQKWKRAKAFSNSNCQLYTFSYSQCHPPHQQTSLNALLHHLQQKKLVLSGGLRKDLTCIIPRYMAWLECKHPEAIPADRYSLITAPSHSEDGHEIPSLLPHFSSVDPSDPLQFSDETAPLPTVSTTLESDLLGPYRPSETMPSPVLWFLPNLRLQFLPPQKWFARTFKTFRDYVLACGFYHTFACSFYASQKWFTSAFETMPSPVVSTTTSPVVSTLVYRARPLLSLTGSWGRSVGKAREGLADVISMHEMLT